MLVFNGLIGEGTDNSLWVPFFYVFMPRKTRDMYNRAYKLMEEVYIFQCNLPIKMYIYFLLKLLFVQAVVNAGGILNENLVIMMDFEVYNKKINRVHSMFIDCNERGMETKISPNGNKRMFLSLLPG